MTAIAISFERVTKVHQGRQIALVDISFTVPAGLTIGLLGVNGSVKSTLTRAAISTGGGAKSKFLPLS